MNHSYIIQSINFLHQKQFKKSPNLKWKTRKSRRYEEIHVTRQFFVYDLGEFAFQISDIYSFVWSGDETQIIEQIYERIYCKKPPNVTPALRGFYMESL